MKAANKFKTQEREMKLARKNILGKRRKKNKKSVLGKKLLMDHLKVMLILLLENISSEILHADVVVNE